MKQKDYCNLINKKIKKQRKFYLKNKYGKECSINFNYKIKINK